MAQTQNLLTGMLAISDLTAIPAHYTSSNIDIGEAVIIEISDHNDQFYSSASEKKPMGFYLYPLLLAQRLQRFTGIENPSNYQIANDGIFLPVLLGLVGDFDLLTDGYGIRLIFRSHFFHHFLLVGAFEID